MVEYRSRYTQLLKAIHNSLTLKRKAGWSRNIGAGFIADDIEDAFVATKEGTSLIFIEFKDDRRWYAHPGELNLRETEELAKWAELRAAEEETEKVRRRQSAR